MVATNLAAELASLVEGKVAVVDRIIGSAKKLATLLDIQPTYTLADLCGSPEAWKLGDRACVDEARGDRRARSKPSAVVRRSGMITGASCTGVLTNLLAMNQYVVTDGPTRFDRAAAVLAAQADVNLLVVQLLVPLRAECSSGFSRGCGRRATTLIEPSWCATESGGDAGHLSPSQVAETLGLDVFASIPDDWQTVSAAINLGEPLRSHSPKSKVRIAQQEVAGAYIDRKGLGRTRTVERRVV